MGYIDLTHDLSSIKSTQEMAGMTRRMRELEMLKLELWVFITRIRFVNFNNNLPSTRSKPETAESRRGRGRIGGFIPQKPNIVATVAGIVARFINLDYDRASIK